MQNHTQKSPCEQTAGRFESLRDLLAAIIAGHTEN
jgi:hypothetical protein